MSKIRAVRRINRALRSTAYHEAGHAVAAHREGRRVKRVTIVPDGDTLGSCAHDVVPGLGRLEFNGSARARRTAESMSFILLAGLAAERRFNSRARLSMAHSDYSTAVDVLMSASGSAEEAQAWLRLMEIRTAQFFAVPAVWVQVVGVAEALLECQTMRGSVVQATITEAMRRALPKVEVTIVDGVARVRTARPG